MNKVLAATLPYLQIATFQSIWLITMANFLLIKPTDALISQIYFCQENLHVSGSSSAHHREFSTVYSALAYVITPAWHIPVQNVQWKTPDYGQRNCPKHVEFLDKNKFGELVRQVGFIRKKFVTMHGHMNVIFTMAKLRVADLIWWPQNPIIQVSA